MSYKEARDASVEARRVMKEFDEKLKEFDKNINNTMKEIERDFLEPAPSIWKRLRNWYKL